MLLLISVSIFVFLSFEIVKSLFFLGQIFRILRRLNARILSIILLICFGVIFFMGASTSPIILFVFTVCIISFLLSLYLTKWVLAKDEGPPEMVQVSSHSFYVVLIMMLAFSFCFRF